MKHILTTLGAIMKNMLYHFNDMKVGDYSTGGKCGPDMQEENFCSFSHIAHLYTLKTLILNYNKAKLKFCLKSPFHSNYYFSSVMTPIKLFYQTCFNYTIYSNKKENKCSLIFIYS